MCIPNFKSLREKKFQVPNMLGVHCPNECLLVNFQCRILYLQEIREEQHFHVDFGLQNLGSINNQF